MNLFDKVANWNIYLTFPDTDMFLKSLKKICILYHVCFPSKIQPPPCLRFVKVMHPRVSLFYYSRGRPHSCSVIG